MLDRSEMSFLFLWVINPVVILLYQNCSAIPEQSAFASPPSIEAQAPQISCRALRQMSCLQVNID